VLTRAGLAGEPDVRPASVAAWAGRRILEETGRIDVVAFDGLTVDAARQLGAAFIVRGLRAVSDFETELQMAHMNRKLAPDVDTIFFMTGIEHAYLSSSLVREIATFGGDVSGLVPGSVLRRMRAPLGAS